MVWSLTCCSCSPAWGSGRLRRRRRPRTSRCGRCTHRIGSTSCSRRYRFPMHSCAWLVRERPQRTARNVVAHPSAGRRRAGVGPRRRGRRHGPGGADLRPRGQAGRPEGRELPRRLGRGLRVEHGRVHRCRVRRAHHARAGQRGQPADHDLPGHEDRPDQLHGDDHAGRRARTARVRRGRSTRASGARRRAATSRTSADGWPAARRAREAVAADASVCAESTPDSPGLGAAAAGQGVRLRRRARRTARRRGRRPVQGAGDPAGMGATCGSARRRTGTSRPSAPTTPAAASTCTTRCGASSATRPSTTACSPSPPACPKARRGRRRAPRAARACRGSGRSARRSACSTSASSASAASSTPRTTAASAWPRSSKQHVRVDGRRGRLRVPGEVGPGAPRRRRRRRRARRRARRCAVGAAAGPELLAYRDGRRWRDISSDDINHYVKDVVGGEVSAKDFRTWHGTVLAAVALAGRPTWRRRRRGASGPSARAMVEVAEYLGNTPTVARGSYVDPRVIDLYERGDDDRPDAAPPRRRRRRRDATRDADRAGRAAPPAPESAGPSDPATVPNRR